MMLSRPRNRGCETPTVTPIRFGLRDKTNLGFQERLARTAWTYLTKGLEVDDMPPDVTWELGTACPAFPSGSRCDLVPGC